MLATAVNSGSLSRTGPAAQRPRRTQRLSPPTLRTANGHNREERYTSWLERFFDLAFAGAVGQLAGTLQDHPGLTVLAVFLMLFTPIWWVWVQLSFYADRHESEDPIHRVAFLTAILLCVGMAASAPRALAGSTTGFVIAFVCLRLLQCLLYARARRHLPETRPLYDCFLRCFGTSGGLWLASLAVGGYLRFAFWGTALLIDAYGSLAMLRPGRKVPLNSSHLADRMQIFVLIVLGESVARLISAAATRPWSVPLAVVLGAALVTLAALWWAWITSTDERGLEGHPAIARFTALNLPIVAGIAAASAGLHIAILAADGAGPIGIGARTALYGGVSVFLVASALLPSKKLTALTRFIRILTATGSAVLLFMGAIVEPKYLVPTLTVVLAVGLRAENRKWRYSFAALRRLGDRASSRWLKRRAGCGRRSSRAVADPWRSVHRGRDLGDEPSGRASGDIGVAVRATAGVVGVGGSAAD